MSAVQKAPTIGKSVTSLKLVDSRESYKSSTSLNASTLKSLLINFSKLTRLELELPPEVIYQDFLSMNDVFTSIPSNSLEEFHLDLSDPSDVSDFDPKIVRNGIMSIIRAIAKRWPSIKGVTIINCEMDETKRNPFLKLRASDLKEILELMKNAEELSLHPFNFRRNPYIEAQFPATTIKELTLTKLSCSGYLFSILKAFPLLQSLSIGYESWSDSNDIENEILCKSLESLDLRAITGDEVSGEWIAKLVRSFPNLKILELHFVNVHQQAISRITEAINECFRLERLTAFNVLIKNLGHFKLSEFVHPMPSLKYLSLYPCEMTVDSLKSFLDMCPNLIQMTRPNYSNEEMDALFKTHNIRHD